MFPVPLLPNLLRTKISGSIAARRMKNARPVPGNCGTPVAIVLDEVETVVAHTVVSETSVVVTVTGTTEVVVTTEVEVSVAVTVPVEVV